MSAYLTPNPLMQFFDVTGAPLVGGTLETFAAGTSTPMATYTDFSAAIANPTTITLNTRGEAAVWLGPSAYKFTLRDAASVLIWTADNITTQDALLDLAAFEALLAASGGSSLVGYLPSGAGAVATTVQAKLRQSVSVFDFMSAAQIADVQAGTLLIDVTAPLAAAVAAASHVYCPPGKYRLTTSTFTGLRGFVLEGAASALSAGGVTYLDNTTFVFDGATSGTDGLVFTDFLGLTVKNIVISMRRGGAGGGKALYLYNGHDYTLDGIKVDLLVGSAGGGIVLGNGTGATSTFIGVIKNCKVFGNTSVSFYANFGTSLTFTACYQVGGYFNFVGMAYSTIISCASELTPSPYYAYNITGCENLVFNACGAEGNAKGAFYLTGSFCISFYAPYGAGNNTSADAVIGDLIQMDVGSGAVYNITIDNPTSLSNNAATTSSIYSNAGNGYCTVTGVYYGSLPLGISGNATWLRNKLTFNGYGEQVSWTPTLAGWTNVGAPTVVAKYVKKGSLVTFYVIITPATSISATRSTSTIQGFPWGSGEVLSGSGMQSDGNANSYGIAPVSTTNGFIYPQTSGVLTVPITIVGTVVINT